MVGVSSRFQVILDFWFGKPSDPNYGLDKPFYWSSTPALDAELKKHFEDDWKKARDGEYDNWKEAGPYQTLALIILMDQVPRNIFRNTADIYTTDPQALIAAQFAVAAGYDKELRSPMERKFMYMPFTHSEDLEVQKKSIELFGSLEKYYGPDIWARRYFEIISKFGRFPHRNAILGRESTIQEIEFLSHNSH
jgi:uncharacterized protein (DUF924 family)